MTSQIRALCIHLGIVPTDKIANGLDELTRASQRTGFLQGIDTAFKTMVVAVDTFGAAHDRISIRQLRKVLADMKALLLVPPKPPSPPPEDLS